MNVKKNKLFLWLGMPVLTLGMISTSISCSRNNTSQNVEELKRELNEKTQRRLRNDDKKYTEESYREYEQIVNEIRDISTSPNVSSQDILNATERLNKASEVLQNNPDTPKRDNDGGNALRQNEGNSNLISTEKLIEELDKKNNNGKQGTQPGSNSNTDNQENDNNGQIDTDESESDKTQRESDKNPKENTGSQQESENNMSTLNEGANNNGSAKAENNSSESGNGNSNTSQQSENTNQAGSKKEEDGKQKHTPSTEQNSSENPESNATVPQESTPPSPKYLNSEKYKIEKIIANKNQAKDTSINFSSIHLKLKAKNLDLATPLYNSNFGKWQAQFDGATIDYYNNLSFNSDQNISNSRDAILPLIYNEENGEIKVASLVFDNDITMGGIAERQYIGFIDNLKSETFYYKVNFKEDDARELLNSHKKVFFVSALENGITKEQILSRTINKKIDQLRIIPFVSSEVANQKPDKDKDSELLHVIQNTETTQNN